MATLWLPDACLTSLQAARPVTQVIAQWTLDWFAADPWQVLGGWDDTPPQDGASFKCLARSNGLEVLGAPDAGMQLAQAIVGLEANPGRTDYDAKLLARLAERAIEDLHERIKQLLSDQDLPPNNLATPGFERVFSLLVGPVGSAQVAIECAMSQVVNLARGTHAQSATPTALFPPQTVRDQTKVPVSARLGSAAVTLKDLSDLEQGDLLLLDSKPGDPIELLIDGQRSSINFLISEADGACLLEFQETL